MPNNWKELVEGKKKRQQEAIPKDWIVTPPPTDRLNVLEFPQECGLLTDREIQITESNVEVLLPKLATGEWSSVDVTRAFYKRAIVAQQVVNCLTEIFVDKALERAAYLDEQLKKTGRPIGPLHGLPISLKDQISIKGLETTMGYASWIGRYAEKDAVLTEILYNLGAVPFVRTNVPQTLMWVETFNHVFGRTSNPHNRSLTCGGSTGGEGALLGLRGSVLGIGTDIGGSIRIPSAFNGLYGLRPSYHRIPYRGSVNSLEGQESIPSVLGPLSTSLAGAKIFIKSVIDAKPWKRDSLMLNKPWDQAGYELVEHGGGKQLVFGIIWNDGNVVPHPPITRALKITRDALIAAGHKVVDWEPYKHAELVEAALSIWRAGSVDDLMAVTSESGEPILTTMALDQDAPPLEASAENSRPATVAVRSSASAYELWQAQKRKVDLRNEYLDHWEATAKITGTGRPVDAIIAPCAPYAAPPHGKNQSADYTIVWNTLDYPGFVLPVTRVDQELDKVKPRNDFLNDQDRTIHEFYSPEIFKDAPIGLQVVGRTSEEEALIGMAEIVDKALKGSRNQ